MWKLRCRPFSRLEETGLGLMELCALYFSRTMMDRLAGAPLRDEAERAFAKLERALPPATRRFLDQLPRALQAKPDGRKKHDERKLREVLGRVLDATLLHRRATMRYASASSGRTKDYVVEAQRVAFAHGGIYLFAWVAEYQQIRTFAAERIETFGLLDDTFEPRAMPLEPFGDSLGVNTGKPEKIVVEFEPDTAVSCASASGTNRRRSTTSAVDESASRSTCAMTTRCVRGYSASVQERAWSRRVHWLRTSSAR